MNFIIILNNIKNKLKNLEVITKFFILQTGKNYWHFHFSYKKEKPFLSQNMDKKNGIYFINCLEKNGTIMKS